MLIDLGSKAEISLPELSIGGWYGDYIRSKIMSAAVDDYYNVFEQVGVVSSDEAETEYRLECKIFYQAQDKVSVCLNAAYEAKRSLHPNYYTFCLSFFGKGTGLVTLSRLLGANPAARDRIIECCRRSLSEPEQTALLSVQHLTEQQKWELVSQYTFDNHGLTIWLTPYAILPHAFGVCSVVVPWGIVNRYIPPGLEPIIRFDPNDANF